MAQLPVGSAQMDAPRYWEIIRSLTMQYGSSLILYSYRLAPKLQRLHLHSDQINPFWILLYHLHLLGNIPCFSVRTCPSSSFFTFVCGPHRDIQEWRVCVPWYLGLQCIKTWAGWMWEEEQSTQEGPMSSPLLTPSPSALETFWKTLISHIPSS